MADEKQQGLMVTFKFDEYGIANPFFIPRGGILDSQMTERQLQSCMPKEYVYKTGKDFDWNCYQEDVEIQKRIANAFVYNFKDFQREGRGLFIYSNTKGSGKTMLACCIANEILKNQDLSVKFVNVPDYIELVKDKSEFGREQVRNIMNASLLIVDDIGAQVENKEWITTALFRLIDSRYAGVRPTIFTSNVRMEELKTDSRISDRIYAMSVQVMMPEVNIRRRIADKHTTIFLEKIFQKENTPK